jgi:hypothetical protein
LWCNLGVATRSGLTKDDWLEAAMRAWARGDREFAAAVRRVMEKRLRLLRRQVRTLTQPGGSVSR